MTNREIIAAIEHVCPPGCQESWDNSGWQCGSPGAQCTGALLCVDVTEAILDEAAARRCNLVIAHHPLLFHATRQVVESDDRVGSCLVRALASGISIYSAHTSCDCAPAGVSQQMGLMLGLQSLRPLDETSGLGAIGRLEAPMPWREFLDLVKATFHTPVLRHSAPPSPGFTVRDVALCGGAGADLMPLACEKGAQILVTADCKFNTFLDVGRRQAMLVDAGHYETELCTKEIFYRAITEKFPNFAVCKSTDEANPVKYY
ncbi:Nif3-like dinuclear metal center hexameric protein [Muribaculaceae bacterium Isolate-013 (NCI)]|nr:Nif3-like dinuclear metal center hexameric protein [Muribaculaceae bacterium Isolate-013 (NCI)]